VDVAVPQAESTTVLALPALATSVARARRAVAEVCRSHGRADLADTAALLVSEVVTNAVLHGDGTVEVRAELSGRILRVEVQDDGVGVPTVRRAGPEAEGGRGLALVDALSSRWGVESLAGGKYVWFLLG
jgi:anti-sigma regulatory factor (Ser/Thr protein kinase)